MTYSQAKLRLACPLSYSREEVKEAAIWILNRIDSTDEDPELATFLLANPNPRKRTQERTSHP